MPFNLLEIKSMFICENEETGEIEQAIYIETHSRGKTFVLKDSAISLLEGMKVKNTICGKVITPKKYHNKR